MPKATQPTDQNIKRWTAKRKAEAVMDIFKGKTTVAELSRQFDITPSEIEQWIEHASKGLENALKAKPKDVKAQYETQVKDLQAKVGEWHAPSSLDT